MTQKKLLLFQRPTEKFFHEKRVIFNAEQKPEERNEDSFLENQLFATQSQLNKLKTELKNPKEEGTWEKIKNFVKSEETISEEKKNEYQETITNWTKGRLKELKEKTALSEGSEEKITKIFEDASCYLPNWDTTLDKNEQGIINNLASEAGEIIEADTEYILATGTHEQQQKAFIKLLERNNAINEGNEILSANLNADIFEELEEKGKINAALMIAGLLYKHKDATAFKLDKKIWKKKVNGNWKDFSIDGSLLETGKIIVKEILTDGAKNVYKAAIEAVFNKNPNPVTTNLALVGILQIQGLYNGVEGKTPLELQNGSLDTNKIQWEQLQYFLGKDSEITNTEITNIEKTNFTEAVQTLIQEKKPTNNSGKLFLSWKTGEISILTEEENAKETKNIKFFADKIKTSSNNNNILDAFKKAVEIEALTQAKRFDVTTKTPEDLKQLLPNKLHDHSEKILTALQNSVDGEKKFLTVDGSLTQENETSQYNTAIARIQEIGKNRDDYRKEHGKKAGFIGTILKFFGIDIGDATQTGGIISLIRGLYNIPEPSEITNEKGNPKTFTNEDDAVLSKYLGKSFTQILGKTVGPKKYNDSKNFSPPSLQEKLNNRVDGNKDKLAGGLKNIARDILGRFDKSKVSAVNRNSITFAAESGNAEQLIQMQTYLQKSQGNLQAAGRILGDISNKIGGIDGENLIESITSSSTNSLQTNIFETRKAAKFPDIKNISTHSNKITVTIGDGMLEKAANMFGINTGPQSAKEKEK